MAVRVLQRNDAAQSGTEVQVLSPVPGWTDQQLLDWKRDAHAAAGWTISVQAGGRRVIATKTYSEAERARDPSLPATVERTMRIV